MSSTRASDPLAPDSGERERTLDTCPVAATIARVKGHELLLEYAPRFARELPAGAGMVEIGSERGHGSTRALAEMCRTNGFDFVTVDVDPAVSGDARTLLRDISREFHAVCDYGEQFLERTERTFHIAYLDAFDFYHPHHPEERKAAYAARGTEITDDNAAAMHLACAQALPRCLAVGGYVCFDDVLTGAPEWKGKGRDAIPWLIDNGFELLEWHRTTAMLRRVR